MKIKLSGNGVPTIKDNLKVYDGDGNKISLSDMTSIDIKITPNDITTATIVFHVKELDLGFDSTNEI